MGENKRRLGVKRLAMAFSGPSNSGKTTLICKLAEYFTKEGLSVAIIKHDPKNKASFDTPNKDSAKFFAKSHQTLVMSPKKTTLFSHKSYEDDLEGAINLLEDFDILLVEGLKTLPLPRILVFKDELHEEYFKFAKAVASYKSLPKNCKLARLNLDDIKAIAKYILENAKGV